MDDLLLAICSEHGAFLRREAAELGYRDKAISRLLRGGHWHRIRHGAYTFGELWDQADEKGRHLLQARAALRTAKAPVSLSHSSSALLLGADYWDLPLDDVHLTRHDGKTGRREAGIRQHRGQIVAGDLAESAGIPHTSATRAALEITTIADVEHSLVVVNSLLHNKLTSPTELRDRYQKMQRWPDSLATDLVLRLADGRLESPGETRSAYLFFRGGIPAPEPQYKVFDENGEFFARVDFAWPELGVFIEFDGRVKYSKFLREGETASDAVIREKSREERVCQLTGWRCLRLTWADLARPAVTIAKVRAFLRLSARAQIRL